MPITWKNVGMTPSGAAASLAGASDSFKSAGTLLKEAFQGPLETQLKMTEENRLRDTAARQQEAHTLAQQLGKYQVDEAAFNAGTQAEMFELDKRLAEANIAARGRQYTGTSTKAKPTKEEFLQMQRQSEHYGVAAGLYEKHGGDRKKITEEGMAMGLDPSTMGLAADDLDAAKHGSEAMRKAAMGSKSSKGAGSIMQAPSDLQSDAWEWTTSDQQQKVRWRQKAQQLKDMGFKHSQIATIMNKGYSEWGDGWDEERAAMLQAQENMVPKLSPSD